MKIAFEVDARLIVVASFLGLAGLFVLHAAYPSLFNFWPSSSQDLAAWVQAVGSVAAIVGAVWVANRQSREKKEDDLLRAQWAAAGMAFRLSRFARNLENYVVSIGFQDLESDSPELDEFKYLQSVLDAPRYRPTPEEFAEIVPLPNRAAHRLARGYEILVVLHERLGRGGKLEELFLKSSPDARRKILNKLCDELHTASDMIAVAAKECEKASNAGAPYPSYEERYGGE